MGGTCGAYAPINPEDPAWLTGDGQKAALVLHARATANGETVAEEYVNVPLVGQLGVTVPG